jgi:thioredoxin-dependent peroxiredoxin
MTKLAAGDAAPDFKLPDQDGKKVGLKDLLKEAGPSGSVVVYFYPKDDTPGCTKEACQFDANLKAFEKSGTTVVGISPDDAEKHQKFRAKYKLGLTLLSDPGHETMEAYGAYGEKTLYGKKTVGVIRSTFLIGPDRKVKRAWYSVKADGHAAKVLEEAAG